MCNGARFDHHARLVTRMADTLGFDIRQSVQDGGMLPEQFDLNVFNCMGCHNSEGCETWLGSQDGRATAAPDYCRNKDELEALARP